MAIKFRNKEHENRFYGILAKMNNGDVYHTSVSGKLTASEYMPWTYPAKSYAELTKAILERTCD